MIKQFKNIFQKITKFVLLFLERRAESFFSSFIIILLITLLLSSIYFFSLKKELEKPVLPILKTDVFENRLKDVIKIWQEKERKAKEEIVVPPSPFQVKQEIQTK